MATIYFTAGNFLDVKASVGKLQTMIFEKRPKWLSLETDQGGFAIVNVDTISSIQKRWEP